MRKIILQEWLSIDGYAADANNGTSFLESAALNKESDLNLLHFMDGVDTILLGATTYQLFVNVWPAVTTEQELIADKLNSTPKIVFSSRLEKATWGKWPDATLIKTNAIDELKNLKSLKGKDMVSWGSISLAQDLMQANLIDEYHFRICPLVLGGGRTMFKTSHPYNFELFYSKQYKAGLQLLQYRRLI